MTRPGSARGNRIQFRERAGFGIHREGGHHAVGILVDGIEKLAIRMHGQPRRIRCLRLQLRGTHRSGSRIERKGIDALGGAARVSARVYQILRGESGLYEDGYEQDRHDARVSMSSES